MNPYAGRRLATVPGIGPSEIHPEIMRRKQCQCTRVLGTPKDVDEKQMDD